MVATLARSLTPSLALLVETKSVVNISFTGPTHRTLFPGRESAAFKLIAVTSLLMSAHWRTMREWSCPLPIVSFTWVDHLHLLSFSWPLAYRFQKHCQTLEALFCTSASHLSPAHPALALRDAIRPRAKRACLLYSG